MNGSSEYTRLASERFERKFCIDGLDLHQVEALIRLNPAFFREIYAERWINNIYFDTPSLDCYHENQRGSAQREKMRIRWYGDLLAPAQHPVLEFKKKNGLAGTKDAYPLPGFALSEMSRSLLQSHLAKANLPDAILERTKKLQPTLVNRYRRRYFQDSTGEFRLTRDRDMAYYRVLGEQIEPIHMRKEHAIVLELKYDVSLSDDVAKITRAFPFRMTKNSKYVKGIELFFAPAGI